MGGGAFTPNGLTLKPTDWVRLKLYDEGGIVVWRPAISLLMLSNKSTAENWKNIMNVGSFALPGGPFMKTGTILAKGWGRVVEKAVEYAANGMVVGNLAVRENRGWIIKTFPEKGRRFIELFDLATTVSMLALMGKAMATPTIKNMKQSWDELINASKELSPDDLKKLDQMGEKIAEFDRRITQYEKRAASAEGVAKDTAADLESLKTPDNRGIGKEFTSHSKGTQRPASETPTTAESLRRAEDNFDASRSVVREHKLKDASEGLGFELVEGKRYQYVNEDAILMHIEKGEHPEGWMRKLIKDYPEREFELIRDVNTNEHFIVLGIGEWKRGQVGQSTILSKEFQGRNLVSEGHFHPRDGQIDYVAVFPSIDDWKWYFDGSLVKEGGAYTYHPSIYKKANESLPMNRIRYIDYTDGKIQNTFFGKLPSDYDSINKAQRGFIEKVFKGKPKLDEPYFLIYRDPLTRELKGVQFKSAKDTERFASEQADRFIETHGQIRDGTLTLKAEKRSLTSKTIEKTPQKSLSRESIPKRQPEKQAQRNLDYQKKKNVSESELDSKKSFG